MAKEESGFSGFGNVTNFETQSILWTLPSLLRTSINKNPGPAGPCKQLEREKHFRKLRKKTISSFLLLVVLLALAEPGFFAEPGFLLTLENGRLVTTTTLYKKDLNLHPNSGLRDT